VATNMAGRGVDIVLGGKAPVNGDEPEWQEKHNKVLELGGLHIIGFYAVGRDGRRYPN